MLSEGVSDVIPAREVRSLNSARYSSTVRFPCLSEINQLFAVCLVDGSEVDRENFEGFFECRVFEPFVVIPKRCQVCFLPFEGFLVNEEEKD